MCCWCDPRCGNFLFFLHHQAARQAHHQILQWKQPVTWAVTPQLIEKAKQALGINIGDTHTDGQVTLEIWPLASVRAVRHPVVVVDEEVQGRVRPNKFPQVLRRVQDGQS